MNFFVEGGIMETKSKLRMFLEKVPYLVDIYHYFKYVFPWIFYFKPKVLEINGSKMYLNVNEPDRDLRKTFRIYAANRIHEQHTTWMIERELLRGDQVYLDLGANIGYFSLLASRIVGPKGKVFSFEPEPRNFSCLVKNKELNGYTQMNPFQKAASDKDGKTTLYICPYDTGHHTIRQSEGITSYETNAKFDKDRITAVDVPTISIDAFLKEQNIAEVDLIKIDVEGAEFLAINGMKETLKGCKNTKIIMEFFPLLIEKMGNSPERLLAQLTAELGFEMFEISDDYDSEKSTENFLKKISSADEILAKYREKKMYHINLLLLKRSNARYEQIVNFKL